MDIIAPDDNDLASQGDCRKPAVQWRRGLNITADDFVKVINRCILYDGFGAARKEYAHLCELFAATPGFDEAATAMQKSLDKEQHRLTALERKKNKKKKEKNANALHQSFYMTPNIEQLNGYVERGAEINHNKNKYDKRREKRPVCEHGRHISGSQYRTTEHDC